MPLGPSASSVMKYCIQIVAQKSLCGEASRCFHHYRWVIRISSLSKALEERNVGWPDSVKFFIMFSAVWLSVYVPYHFFSDPCNKNDQWPRGNLRAQFATSRDLLSHLSAFPFFYPHTMSLNIDMKMILPSKCSGSHCWFFTNSWICSKRPNLVNLGNMFHSNSIGSPSIRFRSFKWLLSKYHLLFPSKLRSGSLLYLPDRAPSRRRCRSWHSRPDRFCHTASLSRSMCILRNQSTIHHWSLSGSW